MTTPALEEIAYRIKKLSYRDLRTLADAIEGMAVVAMPTAEMLLAAADCLDSTTECTYLAGGDTHRYRKRDYTTLKAPWETRPGGIPE